MLATLVIILGTFVQSSQGKSFDELNHKYFGGNFYHAKTQQIPNGKRYVDGGKACGALSYDGTVSIGGCVGHDLLSGCVPFEGSKQVPTVYQSPCPEGWTCSKMTSEYGKDDGYCVANKGTADDLFTVRNKKYFGGKFWTMERQARTKTDSYPDAIVVCATEGYETDEYIGGCSGYDLLSGCITKGKKTVLFQSKCPHGTSCRWISTPRQLRGSCA